MGHTDAWRGRPEGRKGGSQKEGQKEGRKGAREREGREEGREREGEEREEREEGRERLEEEEEQKKKKQKKKKNSKPHHEAVFHGAKSRAQKAGFLTNDFLLRFSRKENLVEKCHLHFEEVKMAKSAPYFFEHSMSP